MMSIFEFRRPHFVSKVLVLTLVAVAFCTIIVLQLWAERSGPRHVDSYTRGGYASPDSSWVPPLTLDHAFPFDNMEHRDPALEVNKLLRRPIVDRRFTAQMIGLDPEPEDEITFIPPAPEEGPFGWGTDWVVGVGMPGPNGNLSEDIIEPPSCTTSALNAINLRKVLDKRVKQPMDPSNRVVACVRTKDRGRYLPEWVAHHWAFGVNEFHIFDDDSVDDTRQVLEPFVRAGIVMYQPHRILRNASVEHDFDDDDDDDDMATLAPLKKCVERYRDMRSNSDPGAPRWLVVLDTDEYLSRPRGEMSVGLSEVLRRTMTACCFQVSALQYGNSGYFMTPRGLLLENFRLHADPASAELNGPPKLVIDLGRVEEAGEAPFSDGLAGHQGQPPDRTTLLSSFLVGVARGGGGANSSSCRCEQAPGTELIVRRFAVTREDFVSRKRLYAALDRQQQPTGDANFNAAFEMEALNGHLSKLTPGWRCVVRRVLARAAEGRHIMTDQPLPGLSPHNPMNHGARMMDPYGEHELARTESCVAEIHATPTVEGSTWGPLDSRPVWLEHACRTRFVFVHSFRDTGELELMRLLAWHPWVTSHGGRSAEDREGAVLTSAMPTSRERRGTVGVALEKMCGCSQRYSPGCWRVCPKLQYDLLTPRTVNLTRRQLVQDWIVRFNLKSTPEKPLILVERDPDMLVNSKQNLFPFVSTSILTVRHPLCTLGPPAVDANGVRGKGVRVSLAALREWRKVWQQVLINQVPRTKGAVWVLKSEFLQSPGQEVVSSLWAAVGLPPITFYPSTATPDENSPDGGSPNPRRDRVRRRVVASRTLAPSAFPRACRERLAHCESDPACNLELARSSSLLGFFGYGSSAEILISHRFLWDKEELEWLGKRMSSELSEPPSELRRMVQDRAVLDSDDHDESWIMPRFRARRGQRA